MLLLFILSITHKKKSRPSLLNLGFQFCLYQHRHYIPPEHFQLLQHLDICYFFYSTPSIEWSFFSSSLTWQLKMTTKTKVNKTHLSNFHLRIYLPITLKQNWPFLSFGLYPVDWVHFCPYSYYIYSHLIVFSKGRIHIFVSPAPRRVSQIDWENKWQIHARKVNGQNVVLLWKNIWEEVHPV